jgi:hypothetical protein
LTISYFDPPIVSLKDRQRILVGTKTRMSVARDQIGTSPSDKPALDDSVNKIRNCKRVDIPFSTSPVSDCHIVRE